MGSQQEQQQYLAFACCHHCIKINALNIHLKNYKKDLIWSLSYQTCTCICHSVCQHACWSPVYWSQFQPPPLSDPLGFLGGEQTLSGAHGLWDAQLGHQTAQRNSINHFFTSLPFLLCHLLPPPTSSYTTYQPGDNILSSVGPEEHNNRSTYIVNINTALQF